MFNTALDIEDVGFDNQSGHGLIDAESALNNLCRRQSRCNLDNTRLTNNTNVNIPDSNRQGVESESRTRVGAFRFLTVDYDITHSFTGDLQVTLITNQE